MKTGRWKFITNHPKEAVSMRTFYQTGLHKFVINYSALALLVCLLSLSACQKHIDSELTPVGEGQVIINFRALAGGQNLIPGNQYSNFAGEAYTVETFKFYLHGIQFFPSDPAQPSYTDPEHYLIDFGDTTSTSIKITMPAGRYDRLQFNIGVDSIRNVSGAQTGALDPGNGMFWTWNSGYIMAKLEGRSPLANTAGNRFEYHIGGFAGENKVNEKVELLLPLTGIDLETNTSSEVQLSAEAGNWFQGPNEITISTHPICTTPGALSKQISANYTHMFSVININNGH